MKSNYIFDQSLTQLDEAELNQISGGLIGPDQDISEFPRWLWPVIRPAAMVNKIQQVAVKPV